MMQVAERLLRRHPQYITLLAPLTTWTLTFLCGTGHVVYTMFPIIADIALQKNIRPERPMAVASVASQMAICASPVSVAVVSMVSILAAGHGIGQAYGLLDILLGLQQRAPVKFTLVAVNLDQKQPGFPAHVLPEYLTKVGVPFHIETQDTYSVVKEHIPEGKTMCSLCSRLRRGILYRVADELGCTKIALGHHRDDILQTLLLNMFFGGKMKSMPPKLVSDDRQNVVIRPLAYCSEKDIERFARGMEYPIIPCSLCGSQENLQRKAMKEMLNDWNRRFPGRIETMFNAIQNITPSHLMDHKLFDFKSVNSDSGVIDGGDIAFDKPEIPAVPQALAIEPDDQLEIIELS